MINYTPAPAGKYGVFCEPVDGQMKNPCWLDSGVMTYEDAVKKADEMCRANHQWHYYAKPILIKCL